MDKDAIRKRIWLIPDGVPFNLGNMTISITDSDTLNVTGWTNTIHFENITREKVLKELDDLKTSYSNLSESYNELTELVKLKNLTIEFHMAYDDSGKAGIGLCSEINGMINWYIKK